MNLLTPHHRTDRYGDPRVSRQWRAGLVATLAALTLPVSACGQAVQNTPAVTSSAIGRIGEITVADVEFLFTPPIAGDDVYPAGATAPLSVTIVNHGQDPDRLDRVSSPIAAGSIVVVDGLTIPAGHTLTAGQAGLAGVSTSHEDGDNTVALTGLREPIRSGLTYPVVFSFERAGDLLIEVPVDTPDAPR